MMQQFLFSSFHGSGGWRCSTHGKDEKRIGNFCRKALRKEQLGRPRHRWEDNIRLDLREAGSCN
jgi:hypothetical protein